MTISPREFVIFRFIWCGHCPKHCMVLSALAVATLVCVVGSRLCLVRPSLSMRDVEMQVCQLLPESMRALTCTLSIFTGRYFVKEAAASTSTLCSCDFRIAGRSCRCCIVRVKSFVVSSSVCCVVGRAGPGLSSFPVGRPVVAPLRRLERPSWRVELPLPRVGRPLGRDNPPPS